MQLGLRLRDCHGKSLSNNEILDLAIQTACYPRGPKVFKQLIVGDPIEGVVEVNKHSAYSVVIGLGKSPAFANRKQAGDVRSPETEIMLFKEQELLRSREVCRIAVVTFSITLQST